MSDDRPKRDTMSIEETTISNMWEMAAISHMLETAASSMDMVSRLGRSSLMGCSQQIPVRVV